MKTDITTKPEQAIFLDLISISDTLTSAEIRNDAVFMAASHLDDMYRDAIQMLTTGVEESISAAKQAIEALVRQSDASEAESIGAGTKAVQL